MSSNPLPLSIIADVTVVTNSPQVSAPTFNKGLIIDSSAHIPSSERVREYLQGNWSSEMLTDGFTLTDPAYIAVGLYFAQPQPPRAVLVGRLDATALQTIAINTPGTGWAVGDTFSISGGTGGVGVVLAAASGIPSSIGIVSGRQGTGYATGTGETTAAVSPSVGTGLLVDISAIGETPLQAFQYCRLANAEWYPGMVCGAAKADHIAIAAWTQTQVGTLYMGVTSDADVPTGTAGNVLLQIFAANSSRTWMQYATTQSGLYPNQPYFAAAVMGRAMGSNTQLSNSSFTMKFNAGLPLVNVFVEPLTSSQVGKIEGTTPGEGPNGNLYLNYANKFNILEQGTMMADLVFMDQMVGLDVLAANIQFNVLNKLTTLPKVPQTDAGQQILVQAVEDALAQSANTGFIAGGIWEGQTIDVGSSKLVAGTALPLGYLVLTPKYSSMSQSDIQARKAPPIYVALIEAGAVHFVTIEVLVQA